MGIDGAVVNAGAPRLLINASLLIIFFDCGFDDDDVRFFFLKIDGIEYLPMWL